MAEEKEDLVPEEEPVADAEETAEEGVAEAEAAEEAEPEEVEAAEEPAEEGEAEAEAEAEVEPEDEPDAETEAEAEAESEAAPEDDFVPTERPKRDSSKQKTKQREARSKSRETKQRANNKRRAQKKHAPQTQRRNVWLLVLTCLLIIGSFAIFMPPQEKINQGLDIQGGLSVVLSANSTDGDAITDEDMETSRDIIETRVNALGASEATVQRQGNNQILVQIPGMSDPQEALDTIGRTGKLEFARLDSFTDEDIKTKIDNGNIVENATVTDDYGNSLPAEHPTNISVEDGTYEPIVTGANIDRVVVDRRDGVGPDYAVNIELDAEGTKAFADASRDLVADHGKIVIILDNEVQSAPAVQSVIDQGHVQITGNYTQDGANNLKTVLDSGSLPVSFVYSQSQTVGPTLGQDALTSGVLVALAGIILVMLYLLFFYNGLGMVTAGAIAVFAILYLGLLALLSSFGLFSLSLAGVAGIVLTIGMAADSSVLTLERFREEIRFGRSVRAASITGVRHGIMTSIDADLVSLVTALSLFFLGSAGVKGFGLTLALGIMCDIVMMLIFKAPLIRLLAPRAIAKHPGFWGVKDCQIAAETYVPLAEAEGEGVETAVSAEAINPAQAEEYAARKGGAEGRSLAQAAHAVRGRFIKHDIPFMRYRKIFLTVAAVAMVICIGLIGFRGLNLGIEFVGGTSITFNGTGDVTTDQLRDAFAAAGENDAVIQSTEAGGEAGFIVRTTQDDAAAAASAATQVAEQLGLSTDSFEVSTIGPDWGTSIIQSMAIALLVSFILIALYIAIRFEYKMGLTALVALLHDIILVIGVYALVGREVNPNTIAALLTILGYSLYDTVVVFHRIADNMKTSDVKCTFMTMANHSVNQVLIRSINTTLTSVIPVIAMLLFGSETLKDFAFAMTIGLLAGTYSSIAIAVPLFAMWKSREPENARLERRYGVQVGTLGFTGAKGGKAEAIAEAPAAVALDEGIAEGVEGVQTDVLAEATAAAQHADDADNTNSAARAAKAKRAAARAAARQQAEAARAARERREWHEPEVKIVDRDKFADAYVDSLSRNDADQK